MSLSTNKNITVLVILYNTPLNKIINLKQYKNFRLIILEQGSPNNSKKNIQKVLDFKFKYYYSKKNLGLSKGINFLIKKIKTKYCLITEPDILIKEKSIINLQKVLIMKKNFLLVGPKYNKNIIKKKYKITKKIDLSCVFFETKKINKFNFYDEDFFFFWTDEDLVRRINISSFQMVIAKNSAAKHFMSSSSHTKMNIDFVRDRSFKYGELVFDYKYKSLRFLKVIRQFIQCFFKTCFYCLIFDRKNVLRNSGYLLGIFDFSIFFLKKKILS